MVTVFLVHPLTDVNVLMAGLEIIAAQVLNQPCVHFCSIDSNYIMNPVLVRFSE